MLEIYVKMTNDYANVVQPIKNNLRFLNCNVCASSQFLSTINNFTNLVALRVTLFTIPTLNALSTFYGSLLGLKYIYLEIVSSFRGKTVLAFNGRSRFQAQKSTDDQTNSDTPMLHNISHLQRLEYLAILTKEKTYVPGCEFEQIAKLKCLEKLICKVRVKPSDALFDEFFENARSLNYLDVRQSDGIDDDGVDRIYENLNHLTYIGLSGCTNIIDSNAALDKMRIINNRVKYNNEFPSENFDEEFIGKYASF